MRIDINGAIVDSEDAWIYDLFDMPCASPKAINKALTEANGDDVEIYINSPGGSVFAGSEIFSAIQEYSGNVNIHITGLAASAASVIAMAGHSEMAPTAQLMVHNVSACAAGNTHDMAHMADVLQKANEAVAAAYVAKTGMSLEDALDLMDAETWLTAKDAKEYGLIDEISENKNANKATEKDTADIPSLVASSSNNGMLPEEVINKFKSEKEKIQLDIQMLKLEGSKV